MRPAAFKNTSSIMTAPPMLPRIDDMNATVPPGTTSDASVSAARTGAIALVMTIC